MIKDEELFHKIYSKYHATMIRYCIGRNLTENDAEEQVQILFELVWKKFDLLKTLEEPQQRLWIYNSMNNILRNKNRRKTLPEVHLDTFENDIRLSVNPIDPIIEEEQFQKYIKEIKESLNNKELELFKAIFENKTPYKELLENYNINPFHLRMQVFRLRTKIKSITRDILFKK